LESTLQKNLVDLARFFLETGDFIALDDLYKRWVDYLNQDNVATFFLAEEVLETLHSQEFVSETLDALDRFGSTKQEEVRNYILDVGSPFADELINRLAEAESMTVRQYYMGCLQDMGGNAHEAILARMNDECWYLVRNLVIVLAQQQDPVLIRKLYAHIDYPHPRVHQEILKLMFTYNRPRAEHLLLEELQSQDVSTQLYAVQVADRSRDKAVQRQVLKILSDSALNAERLELKIHALQALAKIGDAGVVTFLEGLLNSGNLIHPRLFRRLKIETIKTLGHYPAKTAAPLLKKLAKSSGSEIADIATEQLRLLRRRAQ
jgi:HEAT repeat protein